MAAQGWHVRGRSLVTAGEQLQVAITGQREWTVAPFDIEICYADKYIIQRGCWMGIKTRRGRIF